MKVDIIIIKLAVTLVVVFALSMVIFVIWNIDSPRERQVKLIEKCQEQFPELENPVVDRLFYDTEICLSFSDDGTIKGRILEKD